MYARNKDIEKASTYVATAAKDVLPEKINIFVRERWTEAKNETSFDASVEIFLTDSRNLCRETTTTT